MKILIIEDTSSIVETISIALEMQWPGTKVINTSQGENGIEMAETESPDFIILDLALPDISGYEVLKHIRLFSDIPILILTVSSDEANIVKGLEWGADDYMIKPFHQLELIARIRGIIRRYRHQSEKPLVCGELHFEPALVRLMAGPNEIKISRIEGFIIGHLMRNIGNVVSYDSIAKAMWGADFPEAKDSIRVHIRHLREKLEADPDKPQLILNKPGIGYFLAKPSGK